MTGQKISWGEIKLSAESLETEKVGEPFYRVQLGQEWGLESWTGGTAPTAPEAPVIEEFDAAPFEQKKTEAEQTFKRETNERKAARLGAVSRKGTRPLLSGAKA